MSMTQYVFVHGTWHGGWCWKKLLPFLEKETVKVFTPSLTGLGDRYHLADKNIGLSVHIQDIVNLLEFEDLDDVILVGHSYGGMVITGVAEQSNRVGKLVYFDALVPEHGQSAFSMIDGLKESFQQTVDKNGLVPPWEPEEFGVTNKQDIAWMKPRLTPMPILTHAEKLGAPKMKAKKLPRYFIHCTQFGLGNFGEKIKSEGGKEFAINTGHDAMIIKPKELAEVLLKI
jgi:pimeloyl-ACP methyl ester carboxylesterase